MTTTNEPAAIDMREAARLTGLSAKTLERRSNAGEPTGRFKAGTRVLFHRGKLLAWVDSLATEAATATKK